MMQIMIKHIIIGLIAIMLGVVPCIADPPHDCDFDNNGIVDYNDLIEFSNYTDAPYNPTPNQEYYWNPADFNRDFTVNYIDELIMLEHSPDWNLWDNDYIITDVEISLAEYYYATSDPINDHVITDVEINLLVHYWVTGDIAPRSIADTMLPLDPCISTVWMDGWSVEKSDQYKMMDWVVEWSCINEHQYNTTSTPHYVCNHIAKDLSASFTNDYGHEGMYTTSEWATGYGHTFNGMFIGTNPLDKYDWIYVEPQTNIIRPVPDKNIIIELGGHPCIRWNVGEQFGTYCP
jgi:hypothetical protein